MEVAAKRAAGRSPCRMPPVVIDIRSADDSRDVVHRAVQALAEGKLVALPTETVYGLAASALSESAVARLHGNQAPIGRQGPDVGHPQRRRRAGLPARSEPAGPATGAPLLARAGDDRRRRLPSRKPGAAAAPSCSRRWPQRHDRAARAGPSDGARHFADARRAGRADQRQSTRERPTRSRPKKCSRPWAIV